MQNLRWLALAMTDIGDDENDNVNMITTILAVMTVKMQTMMKTSIESACPVAAMCWKALR